MDQKTLLIVDDTETNIENLMLLLGDQYDLLAAIDGKEALQLLEEEDVDLILLDIMMPEMDGFEVCTRVKQNSKTAAIPVIFITAKNDEQSIEKAYEVGGVDYITKPFRAKEVLSRVANHLALSEQQHYLEYMVDKKTKELQLLNEELVDTQKEIIFKLGVVGEYRSKETGNHVRRVAQYCEIIALEYGLSKEEAKMLKDISPLHDIGKIAIADEILNKPARFTPQEFEIMKEHASIGYEILKNSKRALLKNAAIVAYEHHEKYDGTGYPRGLRAQQIHIYGRIAAIADVFDALGSARVYKDVWSDEEILEFFQEQRGKQFDPELVDVFVKVFDHLCEVRDSLKDI